MILIVLFGTLLYFSHTLDLPVLVTEHALTFHQICLRSLPTALENRESLEALVCGKNIHDLEMRQLLVDTSLIHIFVVSGSHFILLRKFLATLFGKTYWILIPLFFYALVTLCQPPSIRALLFLVIQDIAVKKKTFLTGLQIVFLSAVACLALFPQWIHSRSLLMSLTAALAMTTAEELISKDLSPSLRVFLGQSFMFFAMSLCLWGISTLHPLSILMNVLIGPLIGTLLFPLGLLTILIPPVASVFDPAMNALFWILKRVDPLLRANATATPLSLAIQWLLIASLLIAAHQWSVRHKRAIYENKMRGIYEA